MSREVSYSDKAQAMYEVAMDSVKDEIDKAWVHIENVAVLIGDVEDEDLRDRLDKQLSGAMIILEKI